MSPIPRPRNRQSLTPRRSCIVLPLLAKRLILSFSLQNRSLREESRQEVVKVETQTAPDAEKGWSRRRHTSRQSSDGVRHTYIYIYILGWPIAYSQKIKIVKVRLAPVQSMPLIDIKFCAKIL